MCVCVCVCVVVCSQVVQASVSDQRCHLRALWPAMPSFSLGNQRPLTIRKKPLGAVVTFCVCVCWRESFLTGWEVLVWETVIPPRPCGGPSVRSWMRHVSDPWGLQLELAHGHVCPCMYHWCCTLSRMLRVAPCPFPPLCLYKGR